MNRSELESKHLSELHALAAEAGIERYRMLSRGELLDRLSAGGGGSSSEEGRPRPERSQRRERRPRERRPRRDHPEPSAEQPPAPPAESSKAAPAQPAASQERPRRRRRRRRFGRRRKTVRVPDLLLPADGSRQTIVYGETRQACASLLREVAAEISDAKGPDPIGVLIDPSPEELAEWKREAPKAEIVSAGQSRHAGDAVAQAVRRAEAGEDVIVLIDSLSRFAESFGSAEDAQELFDAGRDLAARGSLTVVAAVERPA